MLFLRMALQNAQRRPTRTLMLLLAVALGTAAVFASYTVANGVAASTEQSFARMGADLIVVPSNTMVNITSALLTVQPTEEVVKPEVMKEVAALDGVAEVAPQAIYSVGIMAGMPGHRTNLIAFDPKQDFTITPWITQRQQRPLQQGDIIAGGRRAEAVGEEIQPFGVPANIYAKLGRSGVGPLDESLFTTYDTMDTLSKNDGAEKYCTPKFDRARISAVLVRLQTGATPEQVRFAISKIPGVKVVQGPTIVTATRQTSTILFQGMLAFAGVMLVGALLLVGLLFSAIVSERRREIGVLQAIGAQRTDVVKMLVAEAGFITGLGGFVGLLLGGVLLFTFQNTLVYYLQTVHVEFHWPELNTIGIAAAVCVAATVAIGVIAAALPSWRASAEEPYRLLQAEDARC
jgi:putative ABC transport system permease protein